MCRWREGRWGGELAGQEWRLGAAGVGEVGVRRGEDEVAVEQRVGNVKTWVGKIRGKLQAGYEGDAGEHGAVRVGEMKVGVNMGVGMCRRDPWRGEGLPKVSKSVRI